MPLTISTVSVHDTVRQYHTDHHINIPWVSGLGESYKKQQQQKNGQAMSGSHFTLKGKEKNHNKISIFQNDSIYFSIVTL